MATTSDETVTCDLLVAGSGAGGFAAALSAKLEGLDVLMVEKEPLFGGTTAYSAGVIWIPCNHHQSKAGIDDSREDALAYLTSHVGNRLNRAKAEAFVDQGHEMLERFEREDLVSFIVAPTWADYHPDEPGGSRLGSLTWKCFIDAKPRSKVAAIGSFASVMQPVSRCSRKPG